MSGSISSLFNKERPWGNRFCRSLQKSNRKRIALDFFKKEQRQWFACDSSESLSKTSDSLEKKLFFECFWQFSPFVCQKSESFPLLFAQPLFFKEGRDRFALVALYKRDTMSKLIPSIFKKRNGSDSLFFRIELLFRSFDHKKRVIRSENQWSNSQPCY